MNVDENCKTKTEKETSGGMTQICSDTLVSKTTVISMTDVLGRGRKCWPKRVLVRRVMLSTL